MKLSQKASRMQSSPIRKFNLLAAEAEKQGKKVYRVNIGQPDVVTPPCFMEAIQKMDPKVIAYTESGGNQKLQKAILNYYRQYQMDFIEEDVLITNGGSEAINMVCTSILDPGDEVLVAEPFYTNYHTFITAAEGQVVPITTKAEEGYHFAEREKIEAAITPKTKAICCITPGNPTGNVLSLEEMELIGAIAEEHDLWIIADEVYREFNYDDRSVTSFGMIPGIQDRVVIIDSVSKRFSACGARIGCVISKNRELMENIMKIAQGRLSVPMLEQIGATALFRLPPPYYVGVKREYQARRDVVYEELMKIPGVICQKPGGSFYIMAKLPVDDVEEFLIFLLTEFEDQGETVMFAPAEGFYATPGLGKDEMRIAYVLDKEEMRRSVELIRLGILAYLKK